MMGTVGTGGLASDDLETYGAVSQRDGRFSISGVPSALYVLDAQHNGYVHVPPKSPNGRDDPTVALTRGHLVKDYVVKMTPEAVIVGHVLDENGDPVQYAEVTAEPAAQVDPVRKLRMGAIRTITDNFTSRWLREASVYG